MPPTNGIKHMEHSDWNANPGALQIDKIGQVGSPKPCLHECIQIPTNQYYREWIEQPGF